MEKIAILGSSRGLGASLASVIAESQPNAKLFLISRTLPPIQNDQVVCYKCDLTKQDQIKGVYNFLSLNELTRIVYVAGGGPWGKYAQKDWKDHQWTLQLNLLTPAWLMHELIKNKDYQWRSLNQIVFVGSAIAESKPDPNAASYCAAKHALKGLALSVKQEYPEFDLRLFSPGYMDTMLLPPSAWPRKQADQVKSPREVAERLWAWMTQPSSNTDSNKCHLEF